MCALPVAGTTFRTSLASLRGNCGPAPLVICERAHLPFRVMSYLYRPIYKMIWTAAFRAITVGDERPRCKCAQVQQLTMRRLGPVSCVSIDAAAALSAFDLLPINKRELLTAPTIRVWSYD